MKVKVIDKSGFGLPRYESELAAGLDLKANISERIEIGSLERVIVPTGLYVELPEGFEMQIRPRSGLAAKFGITVLNTPGTIDPDYRGEIKVILINLSSAVYELLPGERIAQAVVARFTRIEWERVEELGSSARGAGGLGHTGKK